MRWVVAGIASLATVVGCGSDPLQGEFAESGGTAGSDTSTGSDSDGGADTTTLDSGGSPDASTGADDESGSTTGDMPEPPYFGPAMYPTGRVHSPVTPFVAEQWHAIAEQGPALREDVFLKTGASSTVSQNTLFCFAGANVDLGNHGHLDPALAYFLGADVGGVSPFNRFSIAAESGVGAGWPLIGEPSALDLEVMTLSPRLALVHFGTNDMGLGSTPATALFPFFDNMTVLLDELLDQGIVPIVFGITRRADNPAMQPWVETYNTTIRGLAQARQVPFIDMYEAIDPLPSNGLGPDGLHLSVNPGGSCILTDEALAFGYNMRNLIALEALDRTVEVLVDDAEELDEAVPPPPGDGSAEEPMMIESLPYTIDLDTTDAPQAAFDSYPGCDAGQSQSGGEYLFRFDLAVATPMRFIVLDGEGVDIDVHLLDETASPQACRARDDGIIEGSVPAGTHHLALDSFDPGDGPQQGRFQLVVVACDPDDLACATPL